MARIRFTVSTPRGVELQKNILGIVQNNILVGMSDNNRDRAFLFLWNGFGFDARCNLAVNKILDKGANFVCGQGAAFKGELLVLDRVLNGESGPLICR